MPRMEWVKDVGYVRAGSWATKNIVEKWRMARRQLEATRTLTGRLDYLMFGDVSKLPAVEREYATTMRECEEDQILWALEELRDEVNRLLTKVPRLRRAEALERVTGRTPEETALFQAKARMLRER